VCGIQGFPTAKAEIQTDHRAGRMAIGFIGII
jgi:hypothetical protein